MCQWIFQVAEKLRFTLWGYMCYIVFFLGGWFRLDGIVKRDGSGSRNGNRGHAWIAHNIRFVEFTVSAPSLSLAPFRPTLTPSSLTLCLLQLLFHPLCILPSPPTDHFNVVFGAGAIKSITTEIVASIPPSPFFPPRQLAF